MSEKNNSASRSEAFRSAIAIFIEERRDTKLKGNEEDAATAARYEYATWLEDAARRVEQIQAVTHVLKATHPNARGSSLHQIPAELPQHQEVGSHLLGASFAEDIVGNAAALDVFKLLGMEVNGKRLLDWMQVGDPDLQAALSENAGTAKKWMQAFSSLIRQEQQPASHVMAKQLYWLTGEEPTDDSQYHLLQPLFSSTLAHAVHVDIQDARFGDSNKAARQARRENIPHEGAYYDYRNLAVRKLGGTKPQNISQLNSERGGVNYLLPSLPPHWHVHNRIKVLHVGSVLDSFHWFEDVQELLTSLSELLLSNPAAIQKTREKREALAQALGQQLALFGNSIRLSQEPGWTRTPDCHLPLCERLWLDPERTALPLRETHASEDADFNAAFTWENWPDQVASRFANWLNHQLHQAGLAAVGDVEYHYWARQVLLDVDWPLPLQCHAVAGGAS